MLREFQDKGRSAFRAANRREFEAAIEFAVLKPWDERGPAENASALVASVRPKLLAIPEAFASPVRNSS